MTPLVLFPSTASLTSGEVEFDCNCACALPARPAGAHPGLPDDARLQTCRPLYYQAFTPDFDLVLSPASPTTLAVVNAPARSVLDFFAQGNTLADLFETAAFSETACRQTVGALWQAGLLSPASQPIL